MTTFRVVKYLDVIEDVAPGLFPVEIDLAADVYALLGVKDNLGLRSYAAVESSH